MDPVKKYELLKRKYKKINKSCEICLSRKKIKIQSIGRVAKPGEYGSLPIYLCKECGHKFQSPIYPENFFKEYYEILYREIAFDGKIPSTKYLNEQKKRGSGVYDWLCKNLKINFKEKILLDHGCASGVTMDRWKKNEWSTFGIDPHKPSVELGKKLGFNVDIGLGEKLPYSREKFSLILSLGSLEHSYNLNKSLKEIRRVLKKNGYLLVRWRSDKIFGSPLEYYNHNHYRFFTNKTWRLVLQKFGFKILKKTDKKLEGWDSYEYFLAQKKENNKFQMENIKYDFKKDIIKLKKLRETYYKNSKNFIKFYEDNKNIENFIKVLKKHKLFKNWGFLGGNSKEVIQRSVMEARLYVDKYEKKKVF